VSVTVAVLRERIEGERRVALAPGQLSALQDAGFSIRVESGGGDACGWSDVEYREAGASIVATRRELLSGADIALGVRPPGLADLDPFPQGCLLVSFLTPSPDRDLVDELARRGVNAIALERVPRTTRAQSMDALSSQATAAGHSAVLLAANRLPRFLPMLTTAAGTIRPATVLVLGAGVAGLQAIATARRLGARVEAYDIRAAAAEQVRSLGATFIHTDLPGDAEVEGGYARALGASEEERQLELLGTHVPRADIVITTAQIPGRPAPRLITREMVEGMRYGSVIVDLAGDSGGNCEISVAGETVTHAGVTVEAPLDLASGLAQDASQMFGRNVSALLRHLMGENGTLSLTLDDDIVKAVLVVHDGHNRYPAS
jgi:H+-translocating NAD(P) transhydrogenase subunit alpha